MIKKLVQAKTTWKYMRHHVKKYIEECPVCQKVNTDRITTNTTPFTTATYEPMARINIDEIGPLVPDDDGNLHILVVIDCFTRFVELYPVKNTGAGEVSKKLIDFIGRYGAPRHIMSDKGTAFVNDTIRSLVELTGSQMLYSIAYSKQENALVERANKEVGRHLRAIIAHVKEDRQWSQYLPLVQRIMNASIHESIGVSPAQLLFGNAVDLDRGLFLEQPAGVDENGKPLFNGKVGAWMKRLLEVQAAFLQIARATQYSKDTNHIQDIPEGEQATEYPINSYVLRMYPDALGKNLPPTKLHTMWEGPFRVVGHVGQEYEIMSLITSQKSKTHVSRLKPFTYDPEFVNPFEVALMDKRLSIVETIISHTGKWTKLDKMKFKVKWVGEENPTKEDWENLKKNAVLHEYMRQKGAEQYIPKAFRQVQEIV